MEQHLVCSAPPNEERNKPNRTQNRRKYTPCQTGPDPFFRFWFMIADGGPIRIVFQTSPLNLLFGQ